MVLGEEEKKEKDPYANHVSTRNAKTTSGDVS